MKILLVYPRLNYPFNAAISPPLGILYIASVLRKNGHDISFLDLTHYETLPDIIPYLKGIELVGLSITSAMAHKAFHVLKTIKGINPALTCIAGGPHATVMPEETLRAGFDAVVLGEGETTVVELAMALDEKKSLSHVSGTAYLENDEMVTTAPRAFISNLDTLPFPARDLVNWEGYYRRSLPFDGIIASRGCPWRCLFCKPMQDKLFGKKIRYRSPVPVIQEILIYQEMWLQNSPVVPLGVPFFIMFIDDMFLSRPEWVITFCDEMEKNAPGIWWGCQARVDTVSEELLKRMMSAGCRQLAFGVESGSQKVLDYLRKDLKLEDTRKAFELCRRLNINTHAYIIIGSPEETKEDLQDTYELLREIAPTTSYVARATPQPGSYLYDYVKEHHILNLSSFDENFDYYYTRMPLKLSHLTEADLDEFEEKVKELFPNPIGLRKGAMKE